jgi:hypothetical protein
MNGLYADRGVVDQSGRKVLLSDHRQTDTAQGPHLSTEAGRRHPHLHPSPNTDPKPFRWTKSADDMLASIERFCLRNTKTAVTSESGHHAMSILVILSLSWISGLWL